MGGIRSSLSQFSEAHGLWVLILLELGGLFLLGRSGRGPAAE